MVTGGGDHVVQAARAVAATTPIVDPISTERSLYLS
jgi:hypothetical protein